MMQDAHTGELQLNHGPMEHVNHSGDHHVGELQMDEHGHHQILDAAGPHMQEVEQEGWLEEHSDDPQMSTVKRVITELQRHWLEDFSMQREKLLVAVAEKLHEDFLADEEKTRAELCAQFKEELETTKEELERKYRDSLKYEIAQQEDRNKKELMHIKRQQWCWQCEKEAIYPCCWNTAYCSVDCQQSHWSQHKKFCRRKKAGGGGAHTAPSQNQMGGQ